MKTVYCFKEKILASSKKWLLCYRKGCLFVKDLNYSSYKKIRIHKWYKSLPLFERIFRKEPRVALALDDDVFMFSDFGQISIVNVNTGEVKITHSFSKGMNNPLSFCTTKDNNGNVKEVFYGEYIWNEDKGPVSIYKFDTKEWRLVYSFEGGAITHVHNITFDKYYNRFIILTGDEDNESAIWEADIDFKEVKQMVGGSQVYRSCVCFPTKEGIYYVTDAPSKENHLFLLKNNKELIDICSINGPSIYGLVYNDSFYFSTSVEGDFNVGKIRYKITNKLAKGIKDRYVHIYCLTKNREILEITKLKKDCLPMWLFQFGNAHFVSTNDGIFYSTQSTNEKGTYKIID